MDIQLLTNEIFIEVMKHQREQVKHFRNITIAVLIAMILQTTIVVGGVLYFFSAYAVEVTDEVITTTQTIEGDNTSINNVDGNNNTITNTNTIPVGGN